MFRRFNGYNRLRCSKLTRKYLLQPKRKQSSLQWTLHRIGLFLISKQNHKRTVK